MKYVLLALLAVTLSACSSSSKKAAKKDGQAAAGAEKAGKEAAKAPAKKDAAAATSAGVVTCKYDSVVRTIEIKNMNGECVVEYTKDGATNEIGKGAVGSTFCQELQDRVKNNLSSAGYTCN